MSTVTRTVEYRCLLGYCNLGYEPQDHKIEASYSTVSDSWSIDKDGETIFAGDDNDMDALIEAIQLVAGTERVYGERYQ